MANRHALLIGVPRYDDDEFNDQRLEAAVRSDIAVMRAALAQSDYTIAECGIDNAERGGATLSRINRAVEEACAHAPADSVLLIYFSGHGVTVDGTDYLVPSDAYRPGGEGAGRPPVVRGLVPVVPAVQALRDCRAGLVAFFVDACRDDSSGARPPAEPGGQQPFLAGGGRFVLVMGCSAGQICQYDETGSAFTQSLAKVLDARNPARTLAAVVGSVSDDMSRRSRQSQGDPQEPAVRNPDVLKLAAGTEICDGDELTDAWRKAVDASPLLTLCPDKDLVRDVVAECARRCGEATAALLARTGLADPWTDQDYPVRVLRNAELLLRNAGILPGAGQAPEARAASARALRPSEAALLAAAPFLREAVLAAGIRDAAAVDPANLERTYTPGQRGDLELTHEMYAHLVRRAVGLRERGDVRASDQIALWLTHQWIAGRARLWDEAGAGEEYRLGGTLIAGGRGTAGEREVPRLVQALLLATGAEPADERLIAKLTAAYVSERWRLLAAVLWLAGIMAADPRRLPPVIADLIGTRMELPLAEVRYAAALRAEWQGDADGVLDLCLVCEHPALHDALEDIARRADVTTETARARLALPPGLAVTLPAGFTSRGLRAAISQDGEPAYDVPLSRFQIAEEKVRELLMGRQLYGDPALAVRELYQNALDACRWRATRQEYLERTEQSPAPWAGLIRFTQGTDDDGRPYIDCEDNGVGMDIDTLKHVFANAGERFVYGQEFRAEQAAWADLDPPLGMVSNSQFGVGVFSYFMLADEITVLTRHQRRDGVVHGQAYEVRIASSGSLLQIRPATGLPGGGTRIRLYLSADGAEVSALKALRGLLVVAEHRVTVTAPDGQQVWESGELEHPDDTVLPLKCGDDLWWVPGAGGIVADGIVTGIGCFGLIVNLRGEHRPQFTVDRKTVHAVDEDWILQQLDAACADLWTWPGFTLNWLWRMTTRDSDLAQHVFDHAVAANQAVCVFPARAYASSDSPGRQREFPVPPSAVGCLPVDGELLESGSYKFLDHHSFSGLNLWIVAWREIVWHDFGTETHYQGAKVRPATLVGYPVPGPLDGELINLLFDRVHQDKPWEPGAQFITWALRRLRKYAITGLDAAKARGLQTGKFDLLVGRLREADWIIYDDWRTRSTGRWYQDLLLAGSVILTSKPAALTALPQTRITATRRPFTVEDLAAVACRLGVTLGDASSAVRDVVPGIELPPVPSDLAVPDNIFKVLFDVRTSNDSQSTGDTVAFHCAISWRRVDITSVVGGALRSGQPLGDYVALLDQFRRLGARLPVFAEADIASLNQVELDACCHEMLRLTDRDDELDDQQSGRTYLESVSALRLVQIAGRFGWTLAHAHSRLSRLVPIGLTLEYPADADLPDEIVYWYDLQALTTYFDGQPPVISGTIDWAYLKKAAEEVFDAEPEEIPAKAAFLRDRLRVYAPLFNLRLPEEDAVD